MKFVDATESWEAFSTFGFFEMGPSYDEFSRAGLYQKRTYEWTELLEDCTVKEIREYCKQIPKHARPASNLTKAGLIITVSRFLAGRDISRGE